MIKTYQNLLTRLIFDQFLQNCFSLSVWELGAVYVNGKLTLAVFGGWDRNDDRNLDSIELFDEDTGTWDLSRTLKLSENKHDFGYISVPSHLICP